MESEIPEEDLKKGEPSKGMFDSTTFLLKGHCYPDGTLMSVKKKNPNLIR